MFEHMERRTTIRLDAALLDRVKRLALDSGRTLTAVIADSLRETLSRTPCQRLPLAELPVSSRSGGTWPGVNLDSWSELLDRMEQPEGRTRRIGPVRSGEERRRAPRKQGASR